MRTQMLVATPLMAALFSPCALAADEAPMFRDLTLSEARAAATEEGKLLFIHNTAEWCGPCKVMEADTYTVDEVQAYFRDNLVAIKVDVDEQKDTAQELGVSAMPTMIVFKDDELFDRRVGLMRAPELMEWFEDVEAGKSELQALLEAAGDRVGEDGKVDIEKRVQIAHALMDTERLDEATEEFIWLWQNITKHDMSAIGEKLRLIPSMKRLAERHEPAREAVVELRKVAKPKIGPTTMQLVDWHHLSWEILGETEPTVEYVETITEYHQGQQQLKRSTMFYDTLRAAGRFDLLVLAYRDGEEAVARTAGRLKSMERLFEKAPDEVRDQMTFQRVVVPTADIVLVLAAEGEAEQALIAAEAANEALAESDFVEACTEILTAWPALAEKLAGFDAEGFPEPFASVLADPMSYIERSEPAVAE